MEPGAARSTKTRSRNVRGVKRRNAQCEPMSSALHLEANSSRTSLVVRCVPILLQKSAVTDGCRRPFRLRAAGFDLPALTLSTQLPRYAMHRA